MVEREKISALFEYRSVSSVDVLRSFFISYYTSSESDNIAAQIDNREHDSSAEVVVGPPVGVLAYICGNKLLVAVAK